MNEPAHRNESIEPWSEAVWSRGSYEEIAPRFLPMAGGLVERTDVTTDDRVLDLGCGPGSAALTAARRGATVTGLDVSSELLEHARENAAIAGLDDVTWREGDVTDVPFEDDSFDVTLSNLGHVYGDPPAAATRELIRVTRPGGRVGFTSWTPTSCVPAMAGTISTFLSPADLPDVSAPPFAWGDAGIVRERLGVHVDDLTCETETLHTPALSPAHFWADQEAHSGVIATVLDAVDEADRPALRTQLIETIESYYVDARAAVRLSYLVTTATVTTTSEESAES